MIESGKIKVVPTAPFTLPEICLDALRWHAKPGALNQKRTGGASERINPGNGIGFSVLEVIEAAQRLTGREIEIKSEPRRAGDPAHLVADASKARALLKWQPATPDLDTIIGTAWAWHSAHPFGYKDV
jgi:UDP-glucose 4-epimerase